METPGEALASSTALAAIGDGRWAGTISAEFRGPAPSFAFGGYLAALMLAAAGKATEHTLPISFTMHYLRPAPIGAEIEIELVRRAGGRRAESLLLSASVAAEVVLEAMAWVGQPVDGPSHSFGRAPEVAGREGLARHDELISATGRRPPTTMTHWEKRLSPEAPSLSSGDEEDPVYREWSRVAMPTRRDHFQEAGRYLLPIDANPWQAIRHAQGQLTTDAIDYLMPTMELTAHFHTYDPSSEWLLHETTAAVAAHGYSSGITRVWSEAGALLATGMSAVTFRPV